MHKYVIYVDTISKMNGSAGQQLPPLEIVLNIFGNVTHFYAIILLNFRGGGIEYIGHSRLTRSGWITSTLVCFFSQQKMMIFQSRLRPSLLGGEGDFFCKDLLDFFDLNVFNIPILELKTKQFLVESDNFSEISRNQVRVFPDPGFVGQSCFFVFSQQVTCGILFQFSIVL